MRKQPENIIGTILAAGQSRRMGKDKLMLAARDGQTVLEAVIATADTSKLETIAVLLHEAREIAINKAHDKVSYRTIKSNNMAHSVKAALDYAAALSASHIMIILGDMPDVTAQDINRLVEQCKVAPNAIIRAVHDGKNGNPVILPLCFAKQFKAQLIGDEGARTIFEAGHIVDVECSAGVLVDIDTPELYQTYLRG
ncbi:nucleotidyltransferase family protein [Ahrensia kielensis]|uniref:nucleotidyltransferase family protein n=1 Tax=Ahrensia kielensis TaxID=76980 RepID=UPI000371B9B6|nr:nucleotidyltransferase family protein [Ahrensia kielensis]